MEKNTIISNPEIVMGKPVIAGTRITVELILEKFAAGESIGQILDAHNGLTRKKLLTAIKFATGALKADVIYPVSEKYV